MQLEQKTILVTGGTGSFGKKFVEIVLKEFKPKKLIILSRDELKQHDMRKTFPDTDGSPVRYFIGADDTQAAAIWREIENRQRRERDHV